MHGHVYASLFCCDIPFLQGKHGGFCDIVASAQSEFFEQVANFDAFTCIIRICYPFKKIRFTLLQKYD